MASDTVITQKLDKILQNQTERKNIHKDGQHLKEMLISMQGRPPDKIKASTTAKSYIS